MGVLYSSASEREEQVTWLYSSTQKSRLSSPWSDLAPTRYRSFLLLGKDDGGSERDEATRTSMHRTSPTAMTSTIATNTAMLVDALYSSEAEDMPGHHLAQTEGFSFTWEAQTVADRVLYSFSEQETATCLQSAFPALAAQSSVAANLMFSISVSGGALPEANQLTGLDVLPWTHYGLAAHSMAVETAPLISPSTPECISPRRLCLQDFSVAAPSPSSDTSSFAPLSLGDASEPERTLSPRHEVQVSTPKSGIKRERRSPSRLCSGQHEVEREAVIPSNIFPCGFPHCVDRRGRPKRFKRQEHKRRHEKTVHGQGEATPSFRCWVQTGRNKCGRVFSRSDNYKAHLRNTHGRRSTRKRNAYVATLDENSRYADIEWQGQLTAEGLPIGHPRFPEIG
ncbi:hypothetical protein LTR24_009966 [Lithohypha guttulata]|uniref:C2H2-type domain-containing protein n=1 Tax=Lithohypha guttulata TaxID=1690604 RepID=A0ABR0JVE9_9EURO|nr:hypothetical protein LTR24_009966 [Lithohypha guttulata]